MLFEPLDAMLGTTAKVRLLRALFASGAPASGREAARRAGVSSRSAALDALEALSALGILERRELAGTHVYEVNRGHHLAPALDALFRAEWERLGELAAAVRRALGDAAAGVRSAIVFGSAARGEAGPGSDLDLLLVTDDDAASDAATAALARADPELRARLGVRASVLALSREQAQARLVAGDPLLANIRSEGRVLFGDPLDEAIGAW